MVELITPYGGKLVDLRVADAREREEWVARAFSLPAIHLSPRSLCDLELLVGVCGTVVMSPTAR